MTAIKICGLTRAEDAEAAVEFGAQALGFVLWEGSPRCIAPADVRRITQGLPPFVTRVGVFVNPTADELARAVSQAEISVAKIHGKVPAFLGDQPPVRILRAVHLAEGAPDGIEPAVGDATVLLDAHDPARHGGTGKTIDWTRAAQVARTRRVILAGGLTPENVGEAIRVVTPYAVDVSSGIETRPGVKDHGLLRRFIAGVKEAV